ncbi:MAG: hypothetical protein ACRDHZ_07410, partial [Ktedonobacteraceae bacterium]
MSNNSQQNKMQECFADVFEQLRGQDIEQFYAYYQLWVMRRRVPLLEHEIEALQAHVAENQQRIQDLRPSAIALAVLARLQSNGVSDIELLDQMLERGEDWLDHMMQRLDYCEQVEDFIQGDYTQWCANSLEGAYDWIDTVRGSTKEAWPAPQKERISTEAEVQATTELLLHKLSFDEDEVIQGTAHQTPASSSSPLTTEETDTKEKLENTENPTYTQALEILATEDVLPTNENETAPSSEAIEAEQVSSSKPASTNDTQPTPWYSISLDESEPFDFERPGSMDDWITVLQSDIAPEPKVDVPQSATSLATELPSEPTEPIEQEEQIVAIQQTISEAQTSSELIHEIEISEVAPANLEVIHIAESSEAEFVSSEAVTNVEQTVETLQEGTVNKLEICAEPHENSIPAEDALPISDATSPEKVTLVKTEQEDFGTANKQLGVPQGATLPKKKGQYKAKKTPKLKLKAGNKPTSKTNAPTNTIEVAEKIRATTSVEEIVVSDGGKERAQIADLVEMTSEDQQQSSKTAEVVSLAHEEKRAQIEPGERIAEESIAPLETSQVKTAETGIINAIFELEEGQLPWYEYLVMEQVGSDESQGSQSIHESAEHSQPSGEQLPIVAEPSDATQPIALKEMCLAREQFQADDTIPLTNLLNESLVERGTVKGEIAVNVSIQESNATKQVVMVAERLKSEQITQAQAGSEISTSAQTVPKRISFWQR